MALFALLGVLSPRRRLYEPEAAGFRLRRTGVRLHVPRAGSENPCLSRHSPFLRATADAALRLRQGFAARVIRTKIAHF
jgi:hypothetical protein